MERCYAVLAMSDASTFPKPTHAQSSEVLALEMQTFEIAFESALEQIASGTTLAIFCANYIGPMNAPLAAGRFRAWMFRDGKRKQAYLAAKALGAEAIEDELLRISDGIRADGSAMPDDVNRNTLQINTRKWLLQVWNRRRYGDVKHIEQNTTTRVDVSNLGTEELRAKVLSSLGFGDEFEAGVADEF
jgi:hypothetical protein